MWMGKGEVRLAHLLVHTTEYTHAYLWAIYWAGAFIKTTLFKMLHLSQSGSKTDEVILYRRQ